jgi:EmrB/QacA subfamily drug resistance transporter
MTAPAFDVERPVLSSRQVASLVAALMTALFLSALDAAAVSTAMPTVVGQLGGLELYTWVFTAYLLTSTTSVPIYGKLADLYGRKRIFLVGIGIFIAGSAACGIAQSMEQLIAARAFQGLGAGALLPVSMTIIGDTFSLEQRAKVQAFFGSVWGISAVGGPAVGGLFTDFLSWRWLFFINLPLGLAAMIMIWVILRERVQHRERSIDYLGAISLTAAIVLLQFAMFEAGSPQGLGDVRFLALFGASVAGFLVFFWTERRAKEPILPLRLLVHPVIGSSALLVVLAGTAMFGLTSFIPLFAQGVLGGTATWAGAAIAPLSFFWPIGSFINSRALIRWGFAPSALFGASMLLLAGIMAFFIGTGTGYWWAVVCGALFGFGMGFVNPTTTIAAQDAVLWSERGVTTALLQFSRTIGGAIGVTAMGVVLSGQLLATLPTELTSPAQASAGELGQASILLDPATRSTLAPATLEAAQAALMTSLHTVFVIIVAFALLAFLASFLFIRGVRRPPEPATDQVTAAVPTPASH